MKTDAKAKSDVPAEESRPLRHENYVVDGVKYHFLVDPNLSPEDLDEPITPDPSATRLSS